MSAPQEWLPATMRLTPERRRCLYLHAAGWSYAQIGQALGIPAQRVQKQLIAVNKRLLPGVTDGPEPAKAYRIVYALGLLDAGVDPEEVPAYLAALVDRAAMGPMMRPAGDEDGGGVAQW